MFILRHHTLRCLIAELTLHRGDMGHRILPVEIWGIIFEFATTCPEEWEFGTRGRRMAMCPTNLRRINTLNRWEDALKTRCSLVVVSRFFNQLTTPLLYQSFFAIWSGQVSRFRSALQTRPALGEYIKRLSLSEDIYQQIITDYPLILPFCPNVVFYDAQLRPSSLRPAPSLRSLELLYTTQFDGLYLLAITLQATPQLEYLGLYHLPFRIKPTNSQPFVSIRLEYLRSLHLRADSASTPHPPGITLTVPLFFSLTLPRLDDLLFGGAGCDEAVLNGIPALWLQKIRQFNVTHGPIMSCRLDPSHFHRLQKFTLDFSSTSEDTLGKLHEKLPFIQLEEIELLDCITSIDGRLDAGFKTLYLVFCLCADDTATPKLRSLSTDIIESGDRSNFTSSQTVKERLDELQSIAKRIHVRGIEPKGADSSSLRSIIPTLIKTTVTWMIEAGSMTEWVSSCSEDEDDV